MQTAVPEDAPTATPMPGSSRQFGARAIDRRLAGRTCLREIPFEAAAPARRCVRDQQHGHRERQAGDNERALCDSVTAKKPPAIPRRRVQEGHGVENAATRPRSARDERRRGVRSFRVDARGREWCATRRVDDEGGGTRERHARVICPKRSRVSRTASDMRVYSASPRSLPACNRSPRGKFGDPSR